MPGRHYFQLRSIISLITVASLSWGCKTFESLSRNSVGQNQQSIADQFINQFDDNFYKPLDVNRNITRSSNNDDDYSEYEPDAGRIIDYGLSEFINDQVTPADIGCHNYRIQAALDERNSEDTGDGCLPYNRELYGENGGAQLADYINREVQKAKREGRNSSQAKKKAFYRAYGPLAVKLQEESGFPASVLLSQWAKETAWGLSRLVRKANGIAGHSCFKDRKNYDYPLFKVPGTKEPGTIKVDCTYKRPANEKHNYVSFRTLEDSAYAQVHNVLFKKSTAKYYPKVRAEINNALLEGRKPDPYKVIDGLKNYAADRSYRSGLKSQMERDNVVELFDNARICKDEEEEGDGDDLDSESTDLDAQPGNQSFGNSEDDE